MKFNVTGFTLLTTFSASLVLKFEASELLLSEIWIQTPGAGDAMRQQPEIPMSSHPLNQYGFNTSEVSSLMFDLKICNDAFVYLSQSTAMDSAAMFEICIGGASGKKYIKKIGFGLHDGRQAEIDWKDPNPFAIRNIGFRTAKYSKGSGKWIIYQRASGRFCVILNAHGLMELIMVARVGKIACAEICNQYHTCMGFNYNEERRKCELIKAGVEMSSETGTGWVFGTKCFEERCLECI